MYVNIKAIYLFQRKKKKREEKYQNSNCIGKYLHIIGTYTPGLPDLMCDLYISVSLSAHRRFVAHRYYNVTARTLHL